MTFYDGTPGTNGDLQIRAREYNTPTQPYADSGTWTLVADNLDYDTWYTIKVEIDFDGGTYDVYVDNILEGDDINKYENYGGSSITDISFADMDNGRGDFYVDNVVSPI